MSIITDGLRSDGWRSFVKRQFQVLKDMGLMAKNYVIDGYHISLLTMDGIEKARITAPPGAVVVDFTDGKYGYRYADQYGSDFATRLSRPPAEGIVPTALFSAHGELMYHATADYSTPEGVWYTAAASWYAPRGSIPATPSLDETGYIAGAFSKSATSPGATPTMGVAFARNSSLYAMAVVQPTTSRFFVDGVLIVVRDALGFNTGMNFLAGQPSFKGRAFFMRPVWGEDGAVIYVIHYDAASCGTTLGAACVQAYYQEVSTAPLASAGFYSVGEVPQNVLATAFGVTAPCVGGSETELISALSVFLGADWPYSLAPHQRGVFSYGTYDVCFWGPMPDGQVKGIVVSHDGTATVKPLVLPAYDSATQFCYITEVSAGWYSCMVIDMASKDVLAVYYGEPFTSWTPFAHPAGTILRHKTIKADAGGIVALALVYDGAVTWLYEFDSGNAAAWVTRGKIGDGKVTAPDVAVFGDHPYARAAASDSPAIVMLPY